ncbi:MAG: M15 family metallopeptidase [Pseudohongiellaceae bacterium]
MQKQNEFLHRVRQAHQALGIPETFLSECRMPLCNEPDELADTETDFYDRPQQLTPAARSAWMKMKQAAGTEGVELFLISAFRSLAYQQHLITRKLAAGQSIDVILKVNAAPGFSEHHTGRAIDIGTPGCGALVEEFENTKAFEWLTRRACEFKFALSYPRGNDLGIDYEPWHWCFHP